MKDRNDTLLNEIVYQLTGRTIIVVFHYLRV